MTSAAKGKVSATPADMLFCPGASDRLGQRAGSRAGAMSVLCGIAALQSADSSRTVALGELARRAGVGEAVAAEA